MDNNGWIKLHRKFTEWEWYKNQNTKTLFLHLLLMANHKDCNWHGIEIKRGQLITGRLSLSKETGLKQGATREATKKLKSTNEITVKSTNKYSIITIVKYSDYQDDKRKTASKPANNATNGQPTTNQQPATNNKIRSKEDKEIKNIAELVSAEPFNFNSLKEKMLSSKDNRMPIISTYWSYRKFEFENREQYSAGIKRELRAAKLLTGYPLERIKEVMFYLNGQDWIDWVLETVHKYIDKDLTKIIDKNYEITTRNFNKKLTL